MNSTLCYFCGGEMAEWSIAAVLKTVRCNSLGGSNPSLSAMNQKTSPQLLRAGFCFTGSVNSNPHPDHANIIHPFDCAQGGYSLMKYS